MKKLFSLSLILMFLTGCNNPVAEKSIQNVVTTKAVLAKLPQNLNLTGTLKSFIETDLSAKISGRITAFNVETGDRFTKGDILIRFDAETESAVISSINQNLQSAETNLSAVIALYNERIKSAEDNSELVRKNGEKSIELIQAQIDEAKNTALVNTKNLGESSIKLAETQLDTAKKDLKLNAQSVLTNTAIALQNTTDNLDQIVLVSDKNKYLNNSFESNLGALDSSSKVAAETAIKQLMNTNDDFYLNFNNQIIDVEEPTSEVIDENLNSAFETLTLAKLALEKTYIMLLKSSTSTNFTETDLSVYKQTVSDFGENVENLILSIQNIRGEDGVASQIALLENQLNQTTSQATSNESSVSSQIIILESQLQKVQTEVDSQIIRAELHTQTLQKEQEAKIAEAQSLVTQIRGELGISTTTFENTIIKAPFSGVVLEKYVEEGSVILPSTPLLKLADDTKMKVVISAPDSVINSLTLNREVEIKIDSLPNEKFLGKVSKIAPNANPITKKIEVEVELDNSNNKMKPGMYARLSFNLTESEGVIISADALILRYDQTFVFVVENGVAVKKTVGIETQTNGLLVVKSGLKVGDKVIIKGHLYLREGDAVRVGE